jgi:hypothetical protein
MRSLSSARVEQLRAFRPHRLRRSRPFAARAAGTDARTRTGVDTAAVAACRAQEGKAGPQIGSAIDATQQNAIREHLMSD